MTDAPKRIDDDVKKPDSGAFEGSPAVMPAEEVAKQKTAHVKVPEAALVPPDDAAAELSQDSETESKPFDFGGLPDRDLKKNLGCG